MPIHWMKRTTSLLMIASIALCFIGFLTYEWVGNSSVTQTYHHVMQVIHEGMSRGEVLRVLSREGTYKISPQKRDICSPGDLAPSDREIVFVYPDWWYHGFVGFFFCYDNSGSLTYFYLFD